ncbi:MAG: restriction endonuclease subunit S [Candidatus Poribacteria bacterium]|nr:restriction endonuclease subunit S [Candidatus Poribacteria bacterium]
MMNRYPEYKESGVEWIGEIPKHWEIKKLKYVAKILPSNVDKHIYPDEIQVRLCNYTDVYYNDYITVDTVLKKGSCKESEFAKFVLKKSDVIITKDSETPDDIGVPTYVKDDLDNVVCGYHLTMLRPLACRGAYIFRFIQSDRTRRYFEVNSNGITRYGLGKASIENLLLPIPPDSEQQQIANFLDRKTEQIDELIHIKERQIELLQEQRTVLINQAVTKGLDPNVEMKPSGMEWIGEIPAHWKIKKLKYVAKILPSNVDKHIYPDEIQVRLCNYTDVYYNDYITVDTVLKKGSCKESEFAKFVLKKSDVIITKDSETPDDIGVPTYVKDDLDNVVCGYHLTMLRPLACRGAYIFRFIQSDRTRRYFEVNSNGITRYGLGKPSIENLFLPIPPDSEQRQIANFLDDKTEQIDERVATEQRKIELLKEYRQSLISEAVTGKIDVRNEV